MVENVKESLSTSSFNGWNPKILMWSTPFYDVEVLTQLCYRLSINLLVFVTTRITITTITITFTIRVVVMLGTSITHDNITKINLDCRCYC